MGVRFTLRPNSRYSTPQEVIAEWPENTTHVHAEGYLSRHNDNLDGILTILVEEGPTATGPWTFRCAFVYRGPASLPSGAGDMGATVMRADRRQQFLRATMTPSQPMRFRAEGEWFPAEGEG